MTTSTIFRLTLKCHSVIKFSDWARVDVFDRQYNYFKLITLEGGVVKLSILPTATLSRETLFHLLVSCQSTAQFDVHSSFSSARSILKCLMWRQPFLSWSRAQAVVRAQCCHTKVEYIRRIKKIQLSRTHFFVKTQPWQTNEVFRIRNSTSYADPGLTMREHLRFVYLSNYIMQLLENVPPAQSCRKIKFFAVILGLAEPLAWHAAALTAQPSTTTENSTYVPQQCLWT
jgi:hypothetical protein